MYNVDEIGKRLKELRERFGFTQRDLARHFTGTGSLGAAQTRITNWETGRYVPSVSYLVQLAGIFQVSLDWLIRGTNVDKKRKATNLPLIEKIPEDHQGSIQNLLSESPYVEVPQEMILRGAEFLVVAQASIIRTIFFRPGDYLAIKPIEESDLPNHGIMIRGKKRFLRTPSISLLLWEEEKFLGMFVLRASRGDDDQILIRPSLALSASREDRRSFSPLEDVCTRYELVGQVVGWIHFEKV
ncbi:helix-turn-helix transcriptional regulator [bacterium]|nr:helix-turn-helix transcriptional regulator [bacterium]